MYFCKTLYMCQTDFQSIVRSSKLHILRQAFVWLLLLQHVWNVMAHAQKPDLVFQRNGRVHLNCRGVGRQFSRLLAAEVCASAVVMLVMLATPCSDVQCKTTGYPLHSHVSPSLPLPCVTVCHQVSTELYLLLALACIAAGSSNGLTLYEQFCAPDDGRKTVWNM